MSILNDWWQDLKALFFPPECPVCRERMGEQHLTVCTRCRMEAPLTGYTHQFDNPLCRTFWGELPIYHASALIFFSKESGWRHLIHQFKYHGRWHLALDMGRWYGAELRDGGLLQDVDLVVPIPLHPFKRIRRGYNQSEYLAEGIAQSLGVELDCRSVRRSRNNTSQTRRSSHERWENVEGIFSVRHPERLRGKHILLVDDVITTGATLISCGEEILKRVPDCRLSIAALAASDLHRKPY